jgi:hypothetical protein
MDTKTNLRARQRIQSGKLRARMFLLGASGMASAKTLPTGWLYKDLAGELRNRPADPNLQGH